MLHKKRSERLFALVIALIWAVEVGECVSNLTRIVKFPNFVFNPAAILSNDLLTLERSSTSFCNSFAKLPVARETGVVIGLSLAWTSCATMELL
jgi:hypothetical protein